MICVLCEDRDATHVEPARVCDPCWHFLQLLWLKRHRLRSLLERMVEE